MPRIRTELAIDDFDRWLTQRTDVGPSTKE